nr:hypothetical protein [Tanacetum cinerariifolium]
EPRTHKKPEHVKLVKKKDDMKADEKKRDMSKVNCYSCKKEGHFAKDYKKVKVKDYNYYKTNMLLAKKDNRKAVILYEYKTFKATEGEQLLDTYLRYLQAINDLKKYGYKKDNSFNRKKFYAKPTNNNLRTSLASSSANKKPEHVKLVKKKEDMKADEKKRDMSKVKCYSCKKEGHFAKDYKKAKVKDYNYYKTNMLLAKKDSDEQVLLVE